ncbi:MAG: hypothetical protein ABIH36_04210 [bacterium]
MATTLEILILLVLFYLLGKAADLVVRNLRKIGEQLSLNISFLGFILGAFTSLPELAVGIHAIINNVPGVALGNTLGGIMVLFGFIFAVSLILHRRIRTDPHDLTIPLILLYLAAPVLLGSNGTISITDGALLTGAYLVLLSVLYLKNRQRSFRRRWRTSNNRDIITNIFWIGTGLVLVVILSNLVVNSTVSMLQDMGVSYFLIGLLVFAIGTNLPEIIITFRSWLRHVPELAINNILGSAVANVLVIGLLALTQPITVALTSSYIVLTIALTILLGMLYVFFRTGSRFTHREGWALLALYAAFFGTQILFARV